MITPPPNSDIPLPSIEADPVKPRQHRLLHCSPRSLPAWIAHCAEVGAGAPPDFQSVDTLLEDPAIAGISPTLALRSTLDGRQGFCIEQGSLHYSNQHRANTDWHQVLPMDNNIPGLEQLLPSVELECAGCAAPSVSASERGSLYHDSDRSLSDDDDDDSIDEIPARLPPPVRTATGKSSAVERRISYANAFGNSTNQSNISKPTVAEKPHIHHEPHISIRHETNAMPHQNITSTKRMRSADFPVLPQPSPKKQRHGQKSPFRAVADESVWDIRSSDQGTPPRAQHKDPLIKSKMETQVETEVEVASENEEWSIEMQCSQFPLLQQATGKALIEEAAKDLQLPRCRLAWPVWRCLSWFRRAYLSHPGVDAPSIDRQAWEDEHLQSFKTVLDMLREKSEDWFTLPIASRRNEQSKFSGEVIGNEQFYTDLDELILPMLTGCIQVILQKCRIQKGGLSEGGSFYRMSKLSVQGTARLLFLQLSLAGALDNARAVEDTQLMDGDEDEDGFMPVKGFDPTRRLRIYKVTRTWLSELRVAIHFGNDAYC